MNIFCWTHGVSVYNNKKNARKSISKVFLNPNIITIAIGLFFFLFSIKLPGLISTVVTYIYNLNTPLSMIVIGYSISQIKLDEMFTDKFIWPGILLRNIAIPAVMMFIIRLLNIDRTALMPGLIMCACPAAGYVVLFAKMNNADTAFPTKYMTISTLLSIITIPLIVSLALMQ